MKAIETVAVTEDDCLYVVVLVEVVEEKVGRLVATLEHPETASYLPRRSEPPCCSLRLSFHSQPQALADLRSFVRLSMPVELGVGCI